MDAITRSDFTHDKVYEYACYVLSAAMFMYEFDDGVRGGSGDHVWKYCATLLIQTFILTPGFS